MSAQKRTAGRIVGAFAGFVGMSAVAGLLITAAVTPALAVTGMAASDSIGLFQGLPGYLKLDQLAQGTTIYAKNSQGQDVPLATFYAQNREEVGWDQISPFIKDAAVDAEDPRFYEHGGVDLQGTIRAALETYVIGSDVQGGSSITQQYVKNVLVQKCEALSDKDKVDTCYKEATETTPDRKLKEMRYAIGLEKKYSKDTILLGYLNITGFGGTVYGIQAAAKYYFGVNAKDVTLPQAASLMAIVQNPSLRELDDPESKVNGKANGYAANKVRRDYILKQMYKYKSITKEQYEAAVKTPIEPHITPTKRGCQTAGANAYFCDYITWKVKSDPVFGKTPEERWTNFNRGGYKIVTTLDLDLQNTAVDAIRSRIPPTVDFGNIAAATTSVQPGTGRVLTMAQTRKYSQNPKVLENPAYTAVNYSTDKDEGGSSGFQVGSTYKVFTLANWLEHGHSLYETVNASVHHYNQSSFRDSCGGPWGGPWNVENDSAGEGGIMSALTATVMSVNTGYAAMGHELDLCDTKKAAQALLVHPADGGELNTNPASILGTNLIAPLTIATAFAGIANNGVVCTPIAIDKIIGPDGKEIAPPKTTCTQGLDPKIAATMAYALERVVTSGTAAASNTHSGVDVLGKTGTTDNNENAWLTESTTKVATSYWSGNVTGHVNLRHHSINGTRVDNIRLYAMRDMMQAAIDKYGGDAFPKPDSKLLRGVQVQVPDLTGKSPQEAENILDGIGLTYADGGQTDSQLPAGVVAATDPAAGSSVPKGTVVSVLTSNQSLIAIPNVVGKSESAARNELRQFKVEKKDAAAANPSQRGKVVKMAPASGYAKPGSTVTIFVGKGG